MGQRPTSFAICINMRFQADQPSCAGRGSEDIADALERGIKDRGIDIVLERLRCFGLCAQGPNLRLIPGGNFHHRVTMADVPALLDMLEAACGHRAAVPNIVGPHS